MQEKKKRSDDLLGFLLEKGDQTGGLGRVGGNKYYEYDLSIEEKQLSLPVWSFLQRMTRE